MSRRACSRVAAGAGRGAVLREVVPLQVGGSRSSVSNSNLTRSSKARPHVHTSSRRRGRGWRRRALPRCRWRWPRPRARRPAGPPGMAVPIPGPPGWSRRGVLGETAMPGRTVPAGRAVATGGRGTSARRRGRHWGGLGDGCAHGGPPRGRGRVGGVGADDANEGAGIDECPGHDWNPTHLTLARDGAYIAHHCTRCGAVMVIGPDELTGRRRQDR